MAGPWSARSARSCVWIISSILVFILRVNQCANDETWGLNDEKLRKQFETVHVVRPTVEGLGGVPWTPLGGPHYDIKRDRRDVGASLHNRVSTKEKDGEEKHNSQTNDEGEDISVNYFAFGQNYTLKLHRNKNLLPEEYFEKYHQNGETVTEKPLKNQSSNHCYYQGHILNRPKSWAAVSLCKGVSGMIFDGQEIHYIEPKSSSLDHIVFKDPKEIPFKCGYNNSESQSQREFLTELHKDRAKRSTNFVREPYKSNGQSRYLELVIVNDHQEYKDRNSNKADVFERSKQIANIVNGLYAPLNIYITLVGVVIWSEYDEIKLSSDGDATLTNFLHYRRQKLSKEHPNDNAQLITAMKFDGGVVGKALKGPICTWEYSGGVNMDHSEVVALVATTVAHEIGHNFGMEHDSDQCHCPDEKCIMSQTSGAISPRHWSDCSEVYLTQAFQQRMDYCLRNKPTKIVGPVCGNGFLEPGEECDCGYKEFCDNKCCNASSCKLYPKAKCATGACCDTNTCQVKRAAFPCRKDYNECDLPEFCDGTSEFCPEDTYVQDFTECSKGKAYCYKGVCKTHEDQCKLLWGSTGKMSALKCYNQNLQGDDNGNCGYYKPNKTHKACHRDDILCGRLHCVHLNEKLEFGTEQAATLAHAFLQDRGKTVICKSAIVDLGIDNVDPGLTPNGAKCGTNKVCLNQKCQPLDKARGGQLCHSKCNSNGLCNNKGNCHCSVGFSPSNCDLPGPGGSIDSGPASDPNAGYQFLVAMYIIFLCIVPLTAIAGFGIYHFRKHLKTWWISKARKAAIKSRARQASMRKPRPPSCVGTDLRNVEISRPLPSDQDVMVHGSNLSRSNSGKETWGRSSLRNMEISPPIPQSSTNSSVGVLVPVRPAPPKPNAPQRTPSWTPGSIGISNGFATVARSASVRTNGDNGRPLSGISRPQCPPPPRPPPPKVAPPGIPLNNTLDALKNENNLNNAKERSTTPNSLIYSDPSDPLDFSDTPLAFVHQSKNGSNLNGNQNNTGPTYGNVNNVGWNDFTSGFQQDLQKKPYLNNSVNIDKNNIAASSKVLKKPVYANGDQAMNIAPVPPPANTKPNLVLSKQRSLTNPTGNATPSTMSTFSSDNALKKNAFLEQKPNASVGFNGASVALPPPSSSSSSASHASVVASLAQKFENKTGDNKGGTTTNTSTLANSLNNRGLSTSNRPNLMRNNSGHHS